MRPFIRAAAAFAADFTRPPLRPSLTAAGFLLNGQPQRDGGAVEFCRDAEDRDVAGALGNPPNQFGPAAQLGGDGVGQFAVDSCLSGVHVDDHGTHDKPNRLGLSSTKRSTVNISEEKAKQPTCRCGHVQGMHPFGLSENLILIGSCLLCDCRTFSSSSPPPDQDHT